jgi:lysyl-tRNA synthetase class 2
MRETRRFFIEREYLEVETPHLIPAPAPESHIDAIPAAGHFLHTSPELCMKRLLAAGYERLFQICRCWRGQERGNRHLPEFTMLEWYRAGADYLDLMEECQELINSLASGMGRTASLAYRGNSIDLSGRWERISVRKAFERYAGMAMEEALHLDLFDEMMVEKIEPFLGTAVPAFLYDYPADRGALAKLKGTDPTVAERFELYIGGLELANGFTELNDPLEQRARFLAEEAYRRSNGKAPYPLPEKFLHELKYMPKSAGIALGMDRLVMVMMDAASIDDVVAFTPEEL